MVTAAAPAKRSIECSVFENGRDDVRAFIVSFVQAKGKLKSVFVIEKQRIFTPGNIVGTFSTRGGGAYSKMPDQRLGKWSGATKGQALNFVLKAVDGAATFQIDPVDNKPNSFVMGWSASLVTRFGDGQTGGGTGFCTEAPLPAEKVSK